MKAFAMSMLALVVIAVVAWFALSQLGWNVAEVYSSSNVRM